MKVALDTNVIAYAEGIDTVEKHDIAVKVINNLPRETVVVPLQVLGELYNVLLRKGRLSRDDARGTVLGWLDLFTTVPTSPEVMTVAFDLATDHRLAIWDAVILAAASRAGCRLLLSEDMQDGFTWGGVTVANPFASPRHTLLEAILGGSVRPS